MKIMPLLNSTFYRICAKYRSKENLKLLDEPVEDMAKPLEEEASKPDISLLKAYLTAWESWNDKLDQNLKVLDQEIADLEVVQKFVNKITSDD